MTGRRRLRALVRPSWGWAARVLAVVAVVGMVTIDGGDGVGDWSWVDANAAPHVVAVGGRVVGTAASHARPREQLALPVSTASLLAVLVLVGLLRADARPHRPVLRTLGPPRRGPPRATSGGAPT
jgi:hypothetical protein